MPFIVSHFDLPGRRYAGVKAQNGHFGDGSHAVWPATRLKKPIEPSPRWLGVGHNKIYILPTLAKVVGVQSQKYQKMAQKSNILGQIWG